MLGAIDLPGACDALRLHAGTCEVEAGVGAGAGDGLDCTVGCLGSAGATFFVHGLVVVACVGVEPTLDATEAVLIFTLLRTMVGYLPEICLLQFKSRRLWAMVIRMMLILRD